LVEKPLTTSVEEGKALLELAVRGGRGLQVGHLERFNPAMRALGGRVTEPRFIECQRLAQFGERGTDVDVVLDLMIHDLDLILTMVTSPVRAVEAVGVPVLTPSVDIANARLRFANGCIANLTASRVSLRRERKLRIFQPDAYFSIDFDERRGRVVRREPDDAGQPSLTFEDLEVREGEALEEGIEGFVRAGRGARDPGERRDGGARGAGRSSVMSYSGEASQAVRVHAPWRVLLVAGEASGDLHGADLLRALHARRPDVEVFGLGGEHLRAAGMHTIADAREVATVGVVEGVGRLRTLLRVYRTLARRLREERPALCVLIDFPEFNLRLARVARAAGVPVLYYIG